MGQNQTMDAFIYDKIIQEQLATINALDVSFRRRLIDDIDWNDRLIVLHGARGVGKTTLLWQRIGEVEQSKNKYLFVSMDDMLVADSSLLDIAKMHLDNGGTHLFIDEIHRYENWSTELKNIYDKYKKLHVVASGSSLLALHEGSADLSRRKVVYNLEGLSFGEFLNIETNNNFPVFSLEDLLKNHVEIANMVNKKVNPLAYLKEYMRHGYYPFYLESTKSYHKKLNGVINYLIDTDLVQLTNVDVSKIAKIKKLLFLMASQAPYTPNISKLSAALELDRNTVVNYISYLDNSELTKSIWSATKNIGSLSKPDKIFLQNPNLFYLYAVEPNIGTLRECFFVNHLARNHDISLPQNGDFLIDNKYTFEVGGKNKSFAQIANLKNSYVVSDDMNYGVGNKIPMWMFGLLG